MIAGTDCKKRAIVVNSESGVDDRAQRSFIAGFRTRPVLLRFLQSGIVLSVFYSLRHDKQSCLGNHRILNG